MTDLTPNHPAVQVGCQAASEWAQDASADEPDHIALALHMTAACITAAARTDVPWLLEQVKLRDKALEAVLELHKPIPCTITDGTGVTEGTVCDHCLNPEWPCATVRAITTAQEAHHA